VHRLEVLANEVADIGDLIGSAYGAAWCNKALKLDRNIHRLRQEVIDHYDDLLTQGTTKEDATDLPLTTGPQVIAGKGRLDWARLRQARRDHC
jgi:hypothetical protein